MRLEELKPAGISVVFDVAEDLVQAMGWIFCQLSQKTKIERLLSTRQTSAGLAGPSERQ